MDGLKVMVVAFFLSQSAAFALGSSATVSAVASGMSGQAAALLSSAGGLAPIVVRLLLGVSVDRLPVTPLRTAGVMLALGGAGYLLLALSGPGTAVVGTLLAFGLARGTNGLMSQATARLFPTRVGVASGRMLSASGLAGVVGPAAFGALAAGGFALAWGVAPPAVLSSAALLLTPRLTRPYPQ